MALNFKTLAYFAGGLVVVATPIALIKSSHYSPRIETSENKNSQSWAGAAAYYHMLKADPATGLIDESIRSASEHEAEMRMINTNNQYKTSALGLNWNELGPDDVGGRVRAICFDRTKQGTVYAGGVSGGIFKSTNGGASWAPINDQLNSMIIVSMSQDATGNTIYFGTGEEQFGGLPNGDGNSAFRGKGLYKLDLATNAVTSLTSTTSYSLVTNVVCHKTDANTIFIGTFGNGFKISNDAGATWHPAKLATTNVSLPNFGNISDVKLASDGSYVFYASNKMYISPNGDDFVADITPTVVTSANRSTVQLAISPTNPSVMYASCVTGGSLMGAVAMTTDKGLTWKKLVTPQPDPFSSGGQGQGAYDNVISVDPKNPYRVFLGGVSFWNWIGDANGNGTWTQAGYQFAFGSNLYVHSDLHALEWDPFNNNTLFVGGDGGVTRTNNNATSFITSNKGFNVTQAYAMGFMRYPVLNSNGYPVGGAVCGNQDNGTTFVSGVYNGSMGALPVNGGDGNYCDFSHVSPSALFTSVYYGQVGRAATPGFYSSTDFYDKEYSGLNGGPGALGGGFASFVTPLRLWENMTDQTSIDSVYFKANSINNLVASANGNKKTFLTKTIKTNNSAIFETLKLTVGTGVTSTVTVDYTTPSSTTVVGLITKRHYVTNVATIPTTVTASSYAGNNDYDSLKIVFATPPASGMNIRTDLTQKYLAGADVKVTTKTAQATFFGYNLTSNLAANDSVKLPDIIKARLAVGISNAVYVVKKPLNFSITPDWVQVAGSKSKDELGSLAAFTGVVQTMAWSANGNHLYVGTQGGALYRISHLHYLKDSMDGVFIGPASSPTLATTFNGINGLGASSVNSPIRCTKIGQFSGGAITSISTSPDTTTANSSVVVTVGGYSNGSKVYYAANATTLTSTTIASNFTAKTGTGATGIISNSPVYSSLIEWKDNKRVLIGTEYGIYGTADITAGSPVWSKENNNKLPNVPVFALRQQTNNSAACYNSGMIYAGTHGRGMWTCDNYYSPTVVGVEEIAAKDNTSVSSIKLYPNPARENVNLSFNIEKSEALTLNIYDLKGVLVMTKYLGKLPEGEQLMQIGTQDLISGNYLVSLTSNNAIVGTNRLVVVK